MNIHRFLRSRRSIRRFKPIRVDMDVVVRILKTAAHAPSAHNRQPWRFVVFSDIQIKARLIEYLSIDFRRDLIADGHNETEIKVRLKRSNTRITDAPVVIILCMDMTEMDIYTDQGGQRAMAERTMAIQSVAAAGLLLQLSARAEGLDSVWTCGPLFAPDAVKTALKLPETWEPQAMYFLGFAAELPEEKLLKPLNDLIIFL